MEGRYRAENLLKKVFGVEVGLEILEHLENLENLEHLGKKRSPFLTVCVEGTSGKGGGDLLSRLRSTIGAAGLNFSVRNGKRWNPGAMTA